MPNIGDKFIVLDDHSRTVPHEAIKGDILEMIGTSPYLDVIRCKNLTKNRGQALFNWGFERLHRLTPFAKGNNSAQLGIDKTRKFVVVDDGHFNFGDVLTIYRDDGTNATEFQRLTDGYNVYLYWHRLAYLPKELDEDYKRAVDDMYQMVIAKQKELYSPKPIRPKELDQLKKEIPKYIQCHTPEEARLVLEKIERDSDLRWSNSCKKPTDYIPVVEYPDCLISTDNALLYCGKKHLPCLKEEEITQAKDYLEVSELAELDKKLDKLLFTDDELVIKPIKIKKTFMTNIIDFAKNLSLSPDEKALREVNLKDENGNWTLQAQQIVCDLKAQSLGYKDEQELIDKMGVYDDEYCDYSPVEYHYMFKEYNDQLLEIANKKIAEDKKCKK